MGVSGRRTSALSGRPETDLDCTTYTHRSGAAMYCARAVQVGSSATNLCGLRGQCEHGSLVLGLSALVGLSQNVRCILSNDAYGASGKTNQHLTRQLHFSGAPSSSLDSKRLVRIPDSGQRPPPFAPSDPGIPVCGSFPYHTFPCHAHYWTRICDACSPGAYDPSLTHLIRSISLDESKSLHVPPIVPRSELLDRHRRRLAATGHILSHTSGYHPHRNGPTFAVTLSTTG